MLLFSKFKWSHLPSGCCLLECGAASEEGWWWGEGGREGKGLSRDRPGPRVMASAPHSGTGHREMQPSYSSL